MDRDVHLLPPQHGRANSFSTSMNSDTGSNADQSLIEAPLIPDSQSPQFSSYQAYDTKPVEIKLQQFEPPPVGSNAGILAVAEDDSMHTEHTSKSEKRSNSKKTFVFGDITMQYSPRWAFRMPSQGSMVVGGDTPDCICCCFRCVCKRCLTHCWFLFVCCGFLLISSLPRITVTVDLITTTLVYLINVRTSEGTECT